jgi:type II secretory pathway pseudopilin PulG
MPTNEEECSVLVVVAIIALTAAILMEAWQRKQDRKQWKKYEDNRRNDG